MTKGRRANVRVLAGSAASDPERLLREGHGHLSAGRYRQAIEVLKTLAKALPEAPWREPLRAAYRGRGAELAAKGMFREAAAILENAAALLGSLPDPGLYVAWLVHGGRPGQAARLVFAPQADAPALGQGPVAELLAGLALLGEPEVLAVLPAAPLLAHRTLLLEAMAAWAGNDPARSLSLLKQLPSRSLLAPVRLLLHALLVREGDPVLAARLLDRIAPDSPWQGAVGWVRVVLLPEEQRLGALANLPPAGRALAARLLGMEAAAVTRLNEISAAADQPETLFRLLTRPASPFPEAAARRVCHALLPSLPRHLAAFQSHFGPLPAWQIERIQALTEERAGRSGLAIRHWERCLAELERIPADPERALQLALILRHLAALEGELPGGWDRGLDHLERSLVHDPDDRETHLWLIRLLAERDDAKAHRLAVERAAKRFPGEVGVMELAMDLALANQAFKKAAGLARTILTLDPLNVSVRKKLAQAHLSHARKQLKAGRHDLADKELAQAEALERDPLGRGQLWVVQGLVRLAAGQAETGLARLEAAREPLGDGVLLYSLGMVESIRLGLSRSVQLLCRRGLDAALKETVPSRETLLRLVTFLERWLGESTRVREATVQLAARLRAYLGRGIELELALEEARLVCHLLVLTDLHSELLQQARAWERRWPGDPAFLFFALYAKCQGRAHKLLQRERMRLERILAEEEERLDPRTFGLIDGFLLEANFLGRHNAGRRRGAPPPFPLDLELDDGFGWELDEDPSAEMVEMLRAAIGRDLAIMRRVMSDEQITRELVRTIGQDFPLGVEVFTQILERLLEEELPGGKSRRQRGAGPSRQLNMEFDD